jgi:hypothetical protein
MAVQAANPRLLPFGDIVIKASKAIVPTLLALWTGSSLADLCMKDRLPQLGAMRSQSATG